MNYVSVAMDKQTLLGNEKKKIVENDNIDDFDDNYYYKDILTFKKKKKILFLTFCLLFIILILILVGGIGFSIINYSQLFSTKNNRNISDKPLKIGICAIAKDENLYIREWIEYYKNMGINKVILYDNNDLDGERLEEVISDYVENGFVKINDRRGIVIANSEYGKSNQGMAYHDCYYDNYKKFDWLFFFDIDEFLSIDFKYNSIFEFLNDFNEYDGIKVQWRMYGDNGHLYYENKPVIERFLSENNVGHDIRTKLIFKCKSYPYQLLFGPHGISNLEPVLVNILKLRIKNDVPRRDLNIYYNLPVYLNHFYSKSTEEYIKRKFNKTDATFGNKYHGNIELNDIKEAYFKYNKITLEKEKMFDSLFNKN